MTKEEIVDLIKEVVKTNPGFIEEIIKENVSVEVNSNTYHDYGRSPIEYTIALRWFGDEKPFTSDSFSLPD